MGVEQFNINPISAPPLRAPSLPLLDRSNDFLINHGPLLHRGAAPP